MSNPARGIWSEVRLGGRILRGWQMGPLLVGEQLGRAVRASDIVGRKSARPRPLTWCAASLTIPRSLLDVDADFRLDAAGVQKGMLFVNGHMLGRHWLIAADGYGPDVRYPHPERHGMSLDSAGQPTQRYYHVPRAWLPETNCLVIVEEQGCLPTRVRLQVRQQNKRTTSWVTDSGHNRAV